MSSIVNICNLALAYLGDDATVSSIDPPEGSIQAEHCSKFYPVALNSLLAMHDWNFATKRVALAQVTNNFNQWQYAYALPSDCMKVISILDVDVSGDYVETVIDLYSQDDYFVVDTPQEFSIELNTDGSKIIYTNQEEAILRYQAYVTDAGKFPPLFAMTLTRQLASMLAGPIIKGQEGARESMNQSKMMLGYLDQAKSQDSNQRDIKPKHRANWISGR